MTENPTKILFVSEDSEDESIVSSLLVEAGFSLLLLRVEHEVDFINELDSRSWDLVLIGDPLVKFTSQRVLEILESRQQKTPYLLIFGSLSDISPVAIYEIVEPEHQFVTKSKMTTLSRMISMELVQSNEKMRRTVELKKSVVEMMASWGRSLELRDKGTQGHTERVTELAVRLARKLGVSKTEIINIHRGALLHDIGKMGIPDSILLKESSLDAAEWVVMKMHPGLAYDMLKPISALKDALEIPYCHHEKWDGSGYPRGLVGEVIPLSARIFSVVDVWDALITDRPYRGAWSKAATLAHIETLAGVAFDPRIVPVFLQMMRET